MSTSKLKLGLVALFAGLLLALPAAAEVSLRGNTVSVSGNTVTFEVADRSVGYDLSVTGEDFRYEERFEAGSLMIWTAAGVEDGLYKYQLVPVAAHRERGVDAPAGPAGETLSGSIRVQAGTLADPARPEKLTKDIVHLDDVIITFSLCVGNDCVNGENFGFDTMRLKENNLRIHFDDTSSAGGFPANDWRLVANDSASGGASYFAIEDSTAGRVPFRVEAGARANALYVEADGDVGIGTANPAVDLEIETGNTPALRLNQDGSSGFTSQVWDVAGNEANFFVRDVTNGSKLSFRIEPGTPENTLYLDSTGRVGIGTNSPGSKLHVVSSTADNIKLTSPNLGILLEESDTANSNIQQFLNNGVFRQRAISGGGGETNPGVSFKVSGSTVGVNCNDGAAPAAASTANFVVGDGDGCDGVYTAITAGSAPVVSSSRALKTNLKAVNAQGILDKIAGIDVYTYDFINGSKDKLGLMAEDFHEVFGRGSDKMINTQEVEMALWLAVKELTAQNKDLAAKLAALESESNKTE